MFGVADRDYSFIINKYHDASAPFDTFKRFVTKDDIFDPATGLSSEELRQGILANDAQNATLPHAVRKAEGLRYVLEHTKICCSPRDRFPCIHAIDQPLDDTLIVQWHTEVFRDTIPDVNKRRLGLKRSGAAALQPDYDHSVPVWDRLFTLGFPGILEAAERAGAVHAAAGTLGEEQKAFFDSIAITYRALIAFVGRLEAQAEKEGNLRMAKALGVLRQGPPQTLYEALLLDYIYFMVSEHMEGLQVRSLGHLDRCLYPFYKADLERGGTEEEARSDLAYFLLQFTAIGNYWNQPAFLGGADPEGNPFVNPLSYLILDTYDRMGIYNPKLQIKFSEKTPRAFLEKALDMVRRGHSSIVFVSQTLMCRALEKQGASHAEACLADVKGCYEYSLQGGMDCSMNQLNLVKPLEYALYGGRDAMTGELFGLETPEAFADFDAFFAAYLKQLGHLIDTVREIVNSYENYLAQVNPQPLLSATYPTCLERAKDALAGGARTNNSVMALGFIATVADSLAMIKKYVFDRGELSLSELRQVLRDNYAGNELLRLKLYYDEDKYGNNKELPDAIAKAVLDFAASRINGRPNASRRSGVWVTSTHVARQSYIQGRKTMATPDGRPAGEELSKNISPAMGMARSGVTAAILTATKLDATVLKGDAALDAALLPSSVQGADGLSAMADLVMAFHHRGGHAIQFNVFNGELLRQAQADPEKYADLQIRVCGWNVLFRDIKKEEQDGFIRQAEALL